MLRWLGSSRIVAAVSLCCLTAAFTFLLVAAVSQVYMAQVNYVTRSTEYAFGFGIGRVSCMFSASTNPLGLDHPASRPSADGFKVHVLGRYSSIRGFRSGWYRLSYWRKAWDPWSTGTDEVMYALEIAHVWLVGSFLLVGLGTSPALTRGLRRRRRLARGGCPACGYDLRATPDRCPECGRVPEVTAT